MAKSSARRTSSRIGLWLLLLVVIGAGAALYSYREPITGYAEDCEKDKLDGMELVTLVDDVEAKSVTARFPLVTSTTATYREGYGCVLEKWEG